MKPFYFAKRKLQVIPAATILVVLAISIPLSAQTITTFDAPGAGTGALQGTSAFARDPKFTLAYCQLNEAYVLQYRFGEDHSPQHLAAAKDAAETAVQLEPNREEARLALARYYYHGLSDYRRTEQELSSIPSSAPHEVEFFTLASLV